MSSYIVDLPRGGNPAVPRAMQVQHDAGVGFSAHDWSPDGSRIAGHRKRPDGVLAGIVTYSIQNGTFERMTETGERPRWLSDGRRLVYTNERGGLSLLDSRSKRSREILSLFPDLIWYPVPSPDDRWIYFVRQSAEADLWLLTLR
jgi:dipeptidyl aminopeptidase/acylaminoacyl peptidase